MTQLVIDREKKTINGLRHIISALDITMRGSSNMYLIEKVTAKTFVFTAYGKTHTVRMSNLDSALGFYIPKSGSYQIVTLVTAQTAIKRYKDDLLWHRWRNYNGPDEQTLLQQLTECRKRIRANHPDTAEAPDLTVYEAALTEHSQIKRNLKIVRFGANR